MQFTGIFITKTRYFKVPAVASTSTISHVQTSDVETLSQRGFKNLSSTADQSAVGQSIPLAGTTGTRGRGSGFASAQFTDSHHSKKIGAVIRWPSENLHGSWRACNSHVGDCSSPLINYFKKTLSEMHASRSEFFFILNCYLMESWVKFNAVYFKSRFSFSLKLVKIFEPEQTQFFVSSDEFIISLRLWQNELIQLTISGWKNALEMTTFWRFGEDRKLENSKFVFRRAL